MDLIFTSMYAYKLKTNGVRIGLEQHFARRKTMKVHDLRKAGYKVRVLHHRIDSDTILGEFNPKGGETVIQITTPDGVDLEGRAKCSDKDLYNKRVGVQVALGRALFKNAA